MSLTASVENMDDLINSQAEQAYGKPVPWPGNINISYSREQIDRDISSALNDCSSLAENTVSYKVDCSEFPCILWLNQKTSKPFGGLFKCSAWADAYTSNTSSIKEIRTDDANISWVIVDVLPKNIDYSTVEEMNDENYSLRWKYRIENIDEE